MPHIGLYEAVGAVIALILALRTNTPYHRFWEGRTLNPSLPLRRGTRKTEPAQRGAPALYVTFAGSNSP